MEAFLIFRVLGEKAQAIAQDACEFLSGFPGLKGKDIKIFVKPGEYPEAGNPLPYDVFIETNDEEDLDIAHDAEWDYFKIKELHRKVLARTETTIKEPSSPAEG